MQRTFLGPVGDRTLFTIDLNSEVHNSMISDCSLFPSEDEVILEPNSLLEVVGTYPAGNGLTMIQMRQLMPVDPIIPYGTHPLPYLDNK